MRHTPWIVPIYESVEDLQTLWRMLSTVSSIPLPIIFFMALSACFFVRRHQ
jgi:hypothetical protein